ncbi:hypothetical protein REPUB_Repub13aG0076400 [Reevesia pubescens]
MMGLVFFVVIYWCPNPKRSFQGTQPQFMPLMIDDQQLGFLANFLGIFIFALVIAYHYVMADPKYEGN